MTLYRLALALLLGLQLAACGGSSADAPPAAATAPPRPLHTSAVLVIGGNELFTYDAAKFRWVPRDFGPCARNLGVEGGDSIAMLGQFGFGILNDYPGTVYLVANALELTYTPTADTLDRFASMVNHVVVTGSRAVVVGVPGADDFNASLRTLARAYGAEYSDAINVRCTP